MVLERYQIETDENLEIFEFISIGPKGRILKRIKYIQTEDPRIWNLSMGDVIKVTDEVETLAGLILEIKGEIPAKNEQIQYNHYIFEILAVDNRRIKKVRLSIKAGSNSEEK